MTKKEQKNKKLVAICGFVAVIVAIFAVVLVVSLNGGSTLNEDYFVSDGSKYVETVDYENMAIDPESEEAEYLPEKIHTVYSYHDDEITSIKVYMKYADHEDAKESYDYLIESGQKDNYAKVAVDGVYLVMTVNKSDFEGLTASYVKEMIEATEAINNGESWEAEEEE